MNKSDDGQFHLCGIINIGNANGRLHVHNAEKGPFCYKIKSLVRFFLQEKILQVPCNSLINAIQGKNLREASGSN